MNVRPPCAKGAGAVGDWGIVSKGKRQSLTRYAGAPFTQGSLGKTPQKRSPSQIPIAAFQILIDRPSPTRVILSGVERYCCVAMYCMSNLHGVEFLFGVIAKQKHEP